MLARNVEIFAGLAGLVQHLDQHRAVDAARLELTREIFRRVIAVEPTTGRFRPFVGVPGEPPEMMMRVDDAHAGKSSYRPVHCGSRLSTKARTPMRKSSLP